MAKIRKFEFKENLSSKALSRAAAIFLLTITVIVIAGAVALGYNFGNSATNQQSNESLANQVGDLQSQVGAIKGNLTVLQNKASSLPVMNQKPTERNIRLEWSETQSQQDRFFLPTITVNQGDTMDITFISNDTDAHTFTLEAPYYFQINASVPGTVDALNDQTFSGQPTNNSPGVKVSGTPGNVTGSGTFVAKYSGIYEYFCVYHVQVGMFGYLIILPNAAYNSSTQVTQTSAGVPIDIVPNAGSNTSSLGYSLPTVTLVIGVNNTVTWTNKDTAPHTVTANDGNFSSGNLNPGDTFVWTFSTPGTYSYHCSYHPWMKGTVVVKAG